MPITVILADDHPVMLDGLEHIFSLERDIDVLARCVNGEETINAVRRHTPEVLVLDLNMPGGDGLSVIRALHAEQRTTRVVVLTAAISEDQMIAALRLGVRGIVLKELAPELLVEAVRRVASGGQWLERHVSLRTVNALLRNEAAAKEDNPATALTARELDLARLAGSGLQNKAIGERLGISEGTVKAHLYNIYRKLGVTSRVQLALYLRSKGL